MATRSRPAPVPRPAPLPRLAVAAIVAACAVGAWRFGGFGGPAAGSPVPSGGSGGAPTNLTVGRGSLPRDALAGTSGPDSFAPAMPVRLPACRFDDLAAEHADYDDWALTLVDTIRALPETYEPPDLVEVSRAGLAGSGRVRALVIDDLEALGTAAAEAGRPIAVQSAYRSHDRQRVVFAQWEAASGHEEALRFSARPGHSEHQLGTALDVREANGPAPWEIRFGSHPTGRWLAEHAWEFGFVLSYPDGADATTCYGAEPWHLRYVGRDAAAAVQSSGLTLREWLWERQ